MATNQTTQIQNNVKILLYKRADLRNPFLKTQKIWAYWQMFCGVKDVITEEQFNTLPNTESILRAYRKIQELNPELRPTQETQEQVAKRVNEYRQAFQKKPLDTPEAFSKNVLV